MTNERIKKLEEEKQTLETKLQNTRRELDQLKEEVKKTKMLSKK